LPRINSTSTAAAANDPASRKNGTEAATAKRKPPSGGAANSLETIWAPNSRPFAFSRLSRGTTAGRMDTEAVSNSVSAVPIRKKTT
jgi:hypothetical protein